MIAFVREYIYIRKGVNINISIHNEREVFLLTQAYNHAIQWMANK